MINSNLSGKAASSHTHDDRYYTESEINTNIDNKLTSYSDSNGLGCKKILGVKFIYGLVKKNVKITTSYPGGKYWGEITISVPSSFGVTNYYCINVNQIGGGLATVTLSGIRNKDIILFVSDSESKTIFILLH